MRSKYTIVNSYPRTGTVYTQALINYVYEYRETGVHSMHIPPFLTVKGVNTVNILRDPYEAIASNVYMQAQSKQDVEIILSRTVQEYLDYFKYIDEDRDAVHIVDFNKLKSDPQGEAKKIFKRFSLPFNDALDFTKEEIDAKIREHMRRQGQDLNHKNAHMPGVEKDELRIYCEEIVKSSPRLRLPFEKYTEYLNYCA